MNQVELLSAEYGPLTGPLTGELDCTITNWPEGTITDTGITSSVDWEQAAALAIATINTAAAWKLAQDQYNIARDYWQLAQDEWDYFNSVFRPCEQNALVEACPIDPYHAKYNDTASLFIGAVTPQYATATAEFRRELKLYRLCSDISLEHDIMLDMSVVSTDVVNYAYRYEEARQQDINDIWWNRRINIFNLGRNLLADSAGYARSAANLYSDLGGQAGKAASGAVEALNYWGNKKPTVYPKQAANPLLDTSAYQYTITNNSKLLTPVNGGTATGYGSSIAAAQQIITE